MYLFIFVFGTGDLFCKEQGRRKECILRVCNDDNDYDDDDDDDDGDDDDADDLLAARSVF